MTAKTQKAGEAIAQKLAELWEQNRPLLEQRLLELEHTAALWPQVSPADRTEAAGIAHKLAGSLGMFGRPEGTRLARLLEQTLTEGTADRPQLEQWVRQLREAMTTGRPSQTP